MDVCAVAILILVLIGAAYACASAEADEPPPWALVAAVALRAGGYAYSLWLSEEKRCPGDVGHSLNALAFPLEIAVISFHALESRATVSYIVMLSLTATLLALCDTDDEDALIAALGFQAPAVLLSLVGQLGADVHEDEALARRARLLAAHALFVAYILVSSKASAILSIVATLVAAEPIHAQLRG